MTGSNFDRPPPGVTALAHLQLLGQNGLALALNNTWHAGGRIVAGILAGWDAVYGPGIAPTNYIGDVFGSLGGAPDFGPGSGGFGGGEEGGSTYAGGPRGGRGGEGEGGHPRWGWLRARGG